MNGKHFLVTMIGVGLLHWGAPAFAADTHGHRSLQEVSDTDLGAMRGRYTIGNNAVAWFGVSMISTWRSSTGQLLQGTLTLGMDFRHDQPQVSFTPTVSITAAQALPAGSPNDPNRSASNQGLANIGGMVQSVQVAGDGNLASNLTSLVIRDGGTPPGGSSGSGIPLGTSADGATVSAGYANGVAQVLLDIPGQGSLRQWIQPGSLGQSVQLTSDNQWVSNTMQIELIRQTTAGNLQLMQGVTQALGLTRGIGNR
ncbi:hypothetical protein [Rhodanobacter glycinis]|uniref:Uncharacterized protein n=1 Tax=Rhodanobacter glycinis TaxID=582702 RepID=A0A1I3YTE2_9GAMM|nr:hypothetical protein [Rhodanobacter glycinis]SFK34501.1 hypothetical protein SAMN05192579_10212 [Rhodanobacter glycinis]